MARAKRGGTARKAAAAPRSVAEEDETAQLELEPTALEVSLAYLRKAQVSRLQAEVWERRAVLRARAAGLSWDRIGEDLGLSGESLRRRYGAEADAWDARWTAPDRGL